MKKSSIRKLTIAGVLVAVAVVGSLFSIPVLGAKCSPVQHISKANNRASLLAQAVVRARHRLLAALNS